jgi:hypothetical protein
MYGCSLVPREPREALVSMTEGVLKIRRVGGGSCCKDNVPDADFKEGGSSPPGCYA